MMRSSIAVLGVTLVLASLLGAQVQPGSLVVSRTQNTGQAAAAGGGLTLYAPGAGGAEIGPLPAGLVGPGVGFDHWNGARSVAVRESDGLLAAGEITSRFGSPVRIHLLDVVGSQVRGVRSAVVGTSVVTNNETPFGSVDQIQFLPDGNLLFVARGIAGYLNSPLGHLDVNTMRVTPRPTSLTPGGAVNAMCLSPDGETAYFGAFAGRPANTTIYAVSVTGGNIDPITVIPGIITGLATEGGGKLLATFFDTQLDLYRIDPATRSFQTFPSNVQPLSGGFLNGIGVEKASGDFFVTFRTIFLAPQGMELFRIDAGTGQASSLGPTTSGVPNSAAARPNPYRFGRVSDRQGQQHRFTAGTNPGGMPFEGNSGFALEIRSIARDPSSGFLLLGIFPAIPPLNIGFDLNLDPLGLVGDPLPLGLVRQTTRIPLPIAANQGYAGVTLFAQAIYVRGNSVSSTEGLGILVLR